MQQRILCSGEVVDGVARELGVATVERDGSCARQDRYAVDGRVEPHHGGDRGQQHDEKRGGEAKDALAVEADDVDAAVVLVLAEKHAGDEESGDDEEDVDADEAARGPRHARVEEHHEENHQASKAFDVGAEARAHGRLYWRHCA